MPAGDLVINNYTLELRTTLMGAGTVYELARQRPFTGLGVPRVKDKDLSWSDRDGSYGGRDRSDVRVVTVAYDILDTPAVALGALKVLHTVWAVSTTDVPLYIKLPGFGKFYVNGRPRGLTDDIDVLTDETACRVEALGTFVTTTDHTLHYV